MKKIFIPTPLDEIIELPKDVTHHVLHVFRHNMEKPITVTGSDNRCGIYQITDEVDGIAQAKLIEYVATDVSSYRTILVQSLLKGEKLEWVLQKATELNVDTIYLVSTANCVVKYDDKKLQSKVSRWEKIMLEAAQQCGRNQLPTLVVGETLSQVLTIEADALKLVAYENEDGHTINLCWSRGGLSREGNQCYYKEWWKINFSWYYYFTSRNCCHWIISNDSI